MSPSEDQVIRRFLAFLASGLKRSSTSLLLPSQPGLFSITCSVRTPETSNTTFFRFSIRRISMSR